MTSTTTQQTAAIITAALKATSAAKPYKAEDNPVGAHSLDQLRFGMGVATSRDQMPALNMALHGGAGYEMENARITGLNDGRADMSQRRTAEARARAERKAQIEAIAASPVVPDAKRLQQAWDVVTPLAEIVGKIADSKKAWSSRFLGSNVDDIGQMALLAMVEVLAKSDKDMDVMAIAANELGEVTKRTKSIPGEQSDDERKERKAVSKARKWLMGMVNNRVMGALEDSYTEVRNLRWDNIDTISTVMATVNGVGDDPMTARFKADKAPSFQGARFASPDGVNADLLAAAINAAITARGLDELAEVLLEEGNTNTNGATRWRHCAKEIFLATPDDNGPWMWDAVVKATEGHANPRKARGEAAQTHVQNLFGFLPSVVMAVIDAFDQYGVEHTSYLGYDGTSSSLVQVTGDAPMAEPILNLMLAGNAINTANMAGKFDGPTSVPDAYGRTTPVIPTEAKSFSTKQPRPEVVSESLPTPELVTTSRARMQSAFESYYATQAESRPLRPALAYATVKEAAEALTLHLGSAIDQDTVIESLKGANA